VKYVDVVDFRHGEMSILDMLTYTPRKKYCNTLIFSLDKIVRRKCSIIGRNLLKIPTECFKLNHWHILNKLYYDEKKKKKKKIIGT
jgi:hypothetical protein